MAFQTWSGHGRNCLWWRIYLVDLVVGRVTWKINDTTVDGVRDLAGVMFLSWMLDVIILTITLINKYRVKEKALREQLTPIESVVR